MSIKPNDNVGNNPYQSSIADNVLGAKRTVREILLETLKPVYGIFMSMLLSSILMFVYALSLGGVGVNNSWYIIKELFTYSATGGPAPSVRSVYIISFATMSLLMFSMSICGFVFTIMSHKKSVKLYS